MKIQTEQQRFSQGEIDPLMIGRNDVDKYYGGLAKATNVFPLRQGGLKSRPGLQLIEQLPDGNHKCFEFVVDSNTKYLIVFSHEEIRVYRNRVLKATIAATDYPSSVIPTINVAQAYDTMIIFSDEVAPHKLFRQNETTWILSTLTFKYVPRYAYQLVETTPAGTLTPSSKEGEITLTTSSGVFTADSVGQYIEGNGGRARITGYVSSTKAKAVTEISFFDTDAIASGSWTYMTGYEPVFSENRGWPTSGVFYEGRLWIGGCKSRPNSIFGSRVNDFYNFNPNTILDDDAIDTTLDCSNKIVNIIAGRNLQVFTIGSEHIAIQSLGDPITPKTVNFKKQTSIGSRPNLRAFEIEGETIFVNTSSIHAFVYDDGQGAYSSQIVSLLSGHLVKNPIDFCVRKAYTDQGATYIVLVNNDNNLCVVDILRSQEVNSFTEQTTQGKFLNCGTDENDIYVITERTINGTTYHYLEVFDDNRHLDFSILKTYETPTNTITGLSLFRGIDFEVYTDAGLTDYAEIDENGVLQLPVDCKLFEIGFNYESIIKDLPVQTPGQGSTIGMKKNISEVSVLLSNTSTCHINGIEAVPGECSPVCLESYKFYRFTGTKTLKGFRGWNDTGQITISKTRPGDLTLLSMSKKVRL